jgi:hypothetical protein
MPLTLTVLDMIVVCLEGIDWKCCLFQSRWLKQAMRLIECEFVVRERLVRTRVGL